LPSPRDLVGRNELTLARGVLKFELARSCAVAARPFLRRIELRRFNRNFRLAPRSPTPSTGSEREHVYGPRPEGWEEALNKN
jgi:hypothetical protein